MNTQTLTNPKECQTFLIENQNMKEIKSEIGTPKGEYCVNNSLTWHSMDGTHLLPASVII